MFKKYWLFAFVSLIVFCSSMYVIYDLVSTDKIGDIAFATCFSVVMLYSFGIIALPKIKEVDFSSQEVTMNDDNDDTYA